MNLEKTKKGVLYAQITICTLIAMTSITIFRNYDPDQSNFFYVQQVLLTGLDTLVTLFVVWVLANMTIFKHDAEWSEWSKIVFYLFFIVISLIAMMTRLLYKDGYIELSDMFVVKNAETIVMGITFIASVINPRYGIANVVAVATVMYIFIEPNHHKYVDAIIIFGIMMALGSVVKFIFFTDWRQYVKEKERDQNAL